MANGDATPRRRSRSPSGPAGEAARPPVEDLPRWAGTAPDWRAAAPPAEPGRPERLAPSRPENVELGPVPAAATPLAAREAANNRFRRGTLLHALLQHLPDLPRGTARRGGTGLAGSARQRPCPPARPRRWRARCWRSSTTPSLRRCSGPDSRAEVPLTGLVNGAVVGGLVDRLAVLDDRVIVADYKTNRRPPTRVEDTPVLYLRQMAAYRAVLRDIFPGRAIVCALVWTQTSQVVMLPDELLDLPGAVPT